MIMTELLPGIRPPFPYAAYIGDKSPIFLFTLESLGLQSSRFNQRFSKSFHQLDWDLYDVRKLQLQLLEQFSVPVKQQWKLAKRFYLGDQKALQHLCTFSYPLSCDQMNQINGIQPFRRRAFSQCRLIQQDKSGWKVELLGNKPFRQPNAGNTYLSWPREFAPIEDWILEDKMFQDMLCGVASMLEKVASPVKSFSMDIHQVMSVATHNASGDNAPEGRHQDGADYIVSALLVERKNIAGGISSIGDKEDATQYFRHELQAGEGLFHCDLGSDIWHDISKVNYQLDRGSKLDFGFRSTFGIDIHLD